ncbi:hypothetical protein [Thiorhodococcus minor]|uniref:Uncharacterized protein n=1 Tax=Thiorhodococcus minor TaxID=57489 RepID=A0A6M0K5M4_9GAMM|nr:hypothetical protein [Thiorhodococcus minor]NEV64544.1 hypothetical protein [Thiorhodococcus minor]
MSARLRAELNGLLEELRHLDARVAHSDAQIQHIAESEDRKAREFHQGTRGELARARPCRTYGCNSSFCQPEISLLHRGADPIWRLEAGSSLQAEGDEKLAA